MQRCKWCDGSGEECGCGQGYCAHCCGTGITASGPLTPQVIEPTLQRSQITALAEEFCARDRVLPLEQLVQRVAVVASGKQIEPESAQEFVQYWQDPTRDENLGEFIDRIAYYAVHC